MKKIFVLCALLLLTAPTKPLLAESWPIASDNCCQYCQQFSNQANNDSFYRANFKITNNQFWQNYKGKIILRVEGRGEAYYVNPTTHMLNYLANPISALSVLKDSGLGITNSNLKKIPVGIIKLYGPDTDLDGLSNRFEQAIGTDPYNFNTDGDRYSDKTEILNHYNPNGPGKLPKDLNLINRLKGRILIQVESAGETWYLNPVDNKRYYLGSQYEAADLISRLAVGVSNWTFNQVTQ